MSAKLADFKKDMKDFYLKELSTAPGLKSLAIRLNCGRRYLKHSEIKNFIKTRKYEMEQRLNTRNL